MHYGQFVLWLFVRYHIDSSSGTPRLLAYWNIGTRETAWNGSNGLLSFERPTLERENEALAQDFRKLLLICSYIIILNHIDWNQVYKSDSDILKQAMHALVFCKMKTFARHLVNVIVTESVWTDLWPVAGPTFLWSQKYTLANVKFRMSATWAVLEKRNESSGEKLTRVFSESPFVDSPKH